MSEEQEQCKALYGDGDSDHSESGAELKAKIEARTDNATKAKEFRETK